MKCTLMFNTIEKKKSLAAYKKRCCARRGEEFLHISPDAFILTME